MAIDPKPSAGQFLGRLNTNCGLNSASPQFSRPAVGLTVFRLNIGFFSGFVCFDIYTFLTRTSSYLIKTHLLPVSHISLALFHNSFTKNKHCSLANHILIYPLPRTSLPSELQTP